MRSPTIQTSTPWPSLAIPTSAWGERICAVVVANGEAPSLDDLIAHAQARRLPKHHWPEVLRVVDTMPMTPAGKIRKADLRAVVTGDGPGSGEVA